MSTPSNFSLNKYVIAIGASAGGLEAIHEFFDNIAADAGLSFVIIQHLSPDHKSLLVELVSKHTHMKVVEAAHHMQVEANCVYVIPNSKLITIKNSKLILSDKLEVKGPNTAIDIFLHSLAKDQGNKAIAIVLSGTGTDGTKGIQSIKNAGGLVLVQDPVTAKFDGMPNSAINTTLVDFILPPELMPTEIYNHIQIPEEDIDVNVPVKERDLNEIFSMVLKETGWNFNHYKQPTLIRRITRRMGLCGFKSLENYLVMLRSDATERKNLSKDFLIGVTKFFRDEAAYNVLQKEVLPLLIQNKNDGDVLKVWVTACSTGEEAYSITMMLDAYLKSENKNITLKVFATDLDENAIDIASKGLYPHAIDKDVPEAYLEQYFNKEAKHYQILPFIRKKIVFAKHNITQDPPFIKNDLISCRNMLIYMSAQLQKKILQNLYFSLNNQGFLFLGPSETVSSIKDKVQEINSRWKFYKKTNDSQLSMAELHGNFPMQNVEKLTPKVLEKVLATKVGKSIGEDFRDALAEDFKYAAVYVDQNFIVKEAIGDFRKYLSLSDNVVNLNVLKMVPDDLSILLSTALRKATKTFEKVVLNRTKVKEQGRVRFIDILIKPLQKNNLVTTLIVFGETSGELITQSQSIYSDNATITPGQELLKELEVELKETKLNLQTAIEELETTNEELQSSNEELLSANEELQSSNEELQSLNEELHTLNTEHQIKIKELIELNNDLDNYFRSNEIGQIFLDDQLRIRKFNPAAIKMINLIETDIGRPLDHVSTNIRHENLLLDIGHVTQKKESIEREIMLSNGTSSLMRIVPYLLHDKKPQGVVITFVDITILKNLNNIINGIFNASLNAIMAFKTVRNISQEITDFEWIAANKASDLLLDKRIGLIGKLLKKEFPALVDSGLYDKLIHLVKNDQSLYTEIYLENIAGGKWFDVVAVKMMDGVVVNFYDTTEKKAAAEKLRKNYSELMIARDKLKGLNLALEQKVEDRTKELSISDERFKLLAKATNDAIWDWSFITNEMWWSESFFTLFGYNDHEELNRSFWLSKIHSEDKAHVEESIYKAINEGVGKQWSAEYRFMKADGTYAHILDRGYVLADEYDTPYRMLGSMLDITRLRRAEREAELHIEERKFLAESIPLIVWTSNLDGELTFLNQTFTQYTGKQIDDAMGKKWHQFVCEKDLNALGPIIEEAIKNKTDFSVEVRLKRFDDEYRWHLLRARAKKDALGNLDMWVGTTTEIHEQKLSNQILEQNVADRTNELQKVVAELETSNIDLQQFAYVASHDLKEPLRKIHMFSHMVKDRYLPKDNSNALDYMERIIGSSARMTKLINDLLNFSRLSVSKLFENTDINVIIHEILLDLELAIAEKDAQINLVNSIPDVQAVPAQIRQVFQNVISNAIKFSKEGIAPVINITPTIVAVKEENAPEDVNGGYCKITISDNGIGFEEKFAGKIFMIFQRLHSKVAYEGTGIGLAVAKKIIEKHNGFISAQSELDKGATFTIILPIKQEVPAEE